jgi:D-serine dehydratase
MKDKRRIMAVVNNPKLYTREKVENNNSTPLDRNIKKENPISKIIINDDEIIKKDERIKSLYEDINKIFPEEKETQQVIEPVVEIEEKTPYAKKQYQKKSYKK